MTDETAMIGDTMETDILGGVQLEFHTVLVLSGGTRPEDLKRYAYQPELIVDSLAEFAGYLDEIDWCSPWHPGGMTSRRLERSAAATE